MTEYKPEYNLEKIKYATVQRIKIHGDDIKTEPRLIFDACVIINMIQDCKYRRNVINWQKKQIFMPVVVDTMMDESAKKLNLKPNDIKEELDQITQKNVQVIQTERSQKVHDFAQNIANNDLKHICHFPDTKMVCLCIWFGWSTITEDRDLLVSLRDWRINAYQPDGYGNVTQFYN